MTAHDSEMSAQLLAYYQQKLAHGAQQLDALSVELKQLLASLALPWTDAQERIAYTLPVLQDLHDRLPLVLQYDAVPDDDYSHWTVQYSDWNEIQDQIVCRQLYQRKTPHERAAEQQQEGRQDG